MSGLLSNLDEVDAVWALGTIVPTLDASIWRCDECGNLIHRHAYGDRNSSCGWEIDHRIPLGILGSDSMSNKRPLHWKVNASLGGSLAQLLSNYR